MVSKNVLVILAIGILLIAALAVLSTRESSTPVKFEDGSVNGLEIAGGSLALTGTSGEWNLSLDSRPGRIVWDWDWGAGADFCMWVKVSFSDHKSIIYVADGSRNPGAQGEYYLDAQGRRRYEPAVIITGVQPGRVERDIKSDYEAHCGLGSSQITDIKVGMAGFGIQSPATRLLYMELIDKKGLL